MWAITWREAAKTDLAEIVRYIGQRIRESVLPLAQFPYLHRTSDRVPGVREMFVRPTYVVLYRVTANQVEIVAIKHSRQNWPTPQMTTEQT